jgi:putative tricarboxylic transport membrane protein
MDPLVAAEAALTALFDPTRLLLLLAGVLIGLVVGLIPGIGGLTALVVLIPFTFGLDSYSAMALLIGMWAVVATSDVIPAIFFGVPGTIGCAATVLDGYPLAKKGEAARALGASYAASTLGGLFGVLVLAVSIPILRPIMLSFGTAELLALCIFGLSMVATLSGPFPLRGLTAAAVGLLIAMVGIDPQLGIERFTFGDYYFWDGVPLGPFTLGLFAVPELAALMIARRQISDTAGPRGYSLAGQYQGLKDVLHHWWLMLRCSWLGATLGAVPGIGASVIDWIAYGHAARTEKNTETFGTGDIRGVIASESSNNAREGGSLIPTIAFGIPGGAATALMLGAFQIQGIVPGPEMLSRHLDVTYLIIASLALATLLGTLICVLASGLMVKLVDIRYAFLVPVILCLALIGGVVGGQHAWADMVLVIGAGLLGWLMREQGWPRAPLLIGLVLGDTVERYLFISVQVHGWEWMTRPIVLVILAFTALGLYRPLRRVAGSTLHRVRHGARGLRFGPPAWFALFFVAVLAAALVETSGWPFAARIAPQIIATVGLACAIAVLILEMVRGDAARPAPQYSGAPVDLAAMGESDPSLPRRLVYRRGALYFAWLGSAAGLAFLLGIVPGFFLFALAFVRFEGRERWVTALAVAAGLAAGIWLVFGPGLGIAWPRSVLGDAFPALRQGLGGLI